MSTQRVPYDDPNAPKEDIPPDLDTWEPLTSEAEAITGAETPEVIVLPPPQEAVESKPEPAPAIGAPALRPGDILADRYEILSLFTEGTFGPVYTMFDRFIRHREALCVLPEEASGARSQRRLARGIEAAKAVHHSGVAALFDLCEDPGRNLRFVTMEGVEGASLAEMLRESNGRLPAWEAFEIAHSLSEALAAAHRHAEHLCLSPRNIIILPDGGLKILELGLADALPRDTVLSLATAAGTEAYLAPELKNRFMEGDARADVYSLGVILYEMLTGLLPGPDPVPPSDLARGVPTGIDRLVLQCLRRPEERPRSMRPVERALRRVLQPRKGYLPLWIAAAASLALVCGALFFMWPGSADVDKNAPVAVAQNAPRASEPTPPPPVAPKPVESEQTKPAAPKPTPAVRERINPPANPVVAPKPKPEILAAVPPPTPADVRPEQPVSPQSIATTPIPPTRVPMPVPASSDATLAPENQSSITVTPALPPAPTNEVAAPTAPEEARPQAPSARGAALRAQREAQSIGAERNAPEDFKAATAALEEGDIWNNAGWTEDADQQYRKAEQHFRTAIRQSLRPIDAQGPTLGSPAAPAPAPQPQDQPPAARSAAPAHSLVFVRLMPGRDGTLDRAEFAFNLLGGGQRRQVFSLGEEIADGWRLESINAATQTVQLRSGSQVVSLAPSSTQRTPVPTASRTTQSP